MRNLCVASCILLLGLAACPDAKAGFVFSGSGIGPAGGNVSASAAFSISGSNLDIILTNTSPEPTAARGDLLTGLIFDIAGPGVTLGTPTIDRNGSDIFAFVPGTHGKNATPDKLKIDNSLSLAGSWTGVLGVSPLGEYGIGTSGLAGAFNASTITRGTGGEDYGLLAAGTFVDGQTPPGSGGFNDSAFPLIQDSLHFVVPFTGGVLDLSDLNNVKFAFGSAGDTIHAVPEPGSLAVWGVLAVGAGAYFYRRKAARRTNA